MTVAVAVITTQLIRIYDNDFTWSRNSTSYIITILMFFVIVAVATVNRYQQTRKTN